MSLMIGVTLATVAALIVTGQPRLDLGLSIIHTAHENNAQCEPFAPRNGHTGQCRNRQKENRQIGNERYSSLIHQHGVRNIIGETVLGAIRARNPIDVVNITGRSTEEGVHNAAAHSEE